ncbi:beta-ketoacyl-[acyl-carrier-protein] synthase family protein [Vibrio mangrovi]|uniref:3-oxoacyl-[acyl-carrier-protein] synthase 2 n=1 Tax=Vibrio mangrovi TaxID=474394 RepID=A0A1Y6IR62_9VIBR|nr:beta-ketoacyl-[acyl-carrier-protein] synthase family protein [Vibrio mangrovi]MDW6001857.1 beta-ketoacyl-[acyl-carrier-protein] synthase family protein [Vibrio mangrovi]SMS00116.1 3-oxoacyl-[acyl-carrier-protein] synthase 2 [Vibrio mangrovi]
MFTKVPNPIFIQACGFHSAMGQTAGQIHHTLRSGVCTHMLSDETILNSGTPTVIGRVEQQLPEIPPHLTRYDSRNNRLALSVLRQIESAVQKALNTYGPDRIAVLIGTSTSGIADGEEAYSRYLSEGQFPADYHYRKQEMGNCSQFIADYFQITGPCYTVSTACSSSGRAFLTAKRMLNANLVDAVIVGGCDTICRLTLNGFNGLEALSSTLCQPFSRSRRGINIGESAALMLLSREPAEIALLGAGDSSDAYHISAPHPEGTGAEQAMRKALQDANLSPEDIGYINAHGTATPLNDKMESLAIHRIFGDQVPVSSTKHLTGHTLGAASATEAAIAWYILTDGLPLPVQHCQDQDPEIQIQLVETEMTLKGKAILSNSFAFGGNNVSLVFGKMYV